MLYALGMMRKQSNGRRVSGWQYERAKQAVHVALKAKTVSPEQRLAQSLKLTGRKLPPEQVQKIAAALRGRTQSQEVKDRKNAKLRGRKRTAEQRARILPNALKAAASLRGVPLGQEHKDKIRAAQLAAWARGRKAASRGASGRFMASTDGGKN